MTAQRSTPFKYQIGQNVWIYDFDGFEQFEVEDRKIINGHNSYLINGKYVHENLIRL
jgi:hypothetical protein